MSPFAEVDADEIDRMATLLMGLAGVARSARAVSGTSCPKRPRDPRDAGALADIAERYLRARRRQAAALPELRLQDPEWDMVIELYCAFVRDRAISVTSLCIASGAAPTTALRHLVRMERAGVVHRSEDPEDGRRMHMRLAESYCAKIEHWIRETWPV